MASSNEEIILKLFSRLENLIVSKLHTIKIDNFISSKIALYFNPQTTNTLLKRAGSVKAIRYWFRIK